MMNRWVVVITGPRLLEELRKIPDERLSFDHAMRDVCGCQCFLSFSCTQSHYSSFKSSIPLVLRYKSNRIMSK